MNASSQMGDAKLSADLPFDRLLAEGGKEPEQPDASLSGRQSLRVGVAEGHDAQPVASAARDVADRNRHAFRDIRLAAVRGTELHGRRGVEHEPGHEHALGELDPDMRFACARGDVPLDLADVVTRNVGPDLRELRALPEHCGAVVARQQPLDAAADADVERAQ
jgi:hypothetical protein